MLLLMTAGAGCLGDPSAVGSASSDGTGTVGGASGSMPDGGAASDTLDPPSSADTGPASSSSSDSANSTDTGDVGDESSSGEPIDPPDDLVRLFVEDTLAAGIDHDSGEVHSPPHCLVDAAVPPLPGQFCAPERYAGGVAATDYNGDGYPDLYISRPYGPDLLYRNLTDGTFVDSAADVGLIMPDGTSGGAWGDVDNDGDQDLYVGSLGDTRNYLFINHDGVFVEEGESRGAAISTPHQHTASTIAFADYDLDGDLDVYVGEWRTLAVGEHPSHARLLRNRGPEDLGKFEDVTDAVGLNIDDVHLSSPSSVMGTFVLSAGWADMDQDGYPDLLQANDFATSRLFWNNGDGTFLDGTSAAGVGTDENGMGSTVGDFDRDGDLDWFVTSIYGPTKTGNRMYRYDGGRTFSDASVDAPFRKGGWGWGTSLFDLDNDADLDLVMTNGWYATIALADPVFTWLNTGDGTMHEAPAAMGLNDDGQGRALITLDADLDGDLDVVIINNAGLPRFFRNETTGGGNWLSVTTPGTTSNRDGLGATITITADGVTQFQEMGSGSSYLGHAPREVHFGLAAAETVDIDVHWPASGQHVTLLDVAANQRLSIPEP